MKIAYKIGLALVGVFLLWVATLTVSSYLAFSNLCGEESLERVEGSDYVAELYERGCGATTRYAYHVNVHKKGGSLKAGLFSSGTITSGEVFTSERLPVEITWVGPKLLRIETTDNSAIHNRYAPAIDGIQVELVAHHLPPLNRN
ncbi:MAG: hypothetical protein JWO20_3288 [Candidatus Angelobacter sp.]|nr:hypothetical protein [Candidatus Angelobacter sp.]